MMTKVKFQNRIQYLQPLSILDLTLGLMNMFSSGKPGNFATFTWTYILKNFEILKNLIYRVYRNPSLLHGKLVSPAQFCIKNL